MSDPPEQIGSLFEQAAELTQRLQAAQESSGDAEIVGSAGGGAVRITAGGDGEFHDVAIDPTAVDPTDVGMLEDLVLAAINDTMNRIASFQRQSLGGLLGGGVEGMLGGLGEMLGGLGGPAVPGGAGPSSEVIEAAGVAADEQAGTVGDVPPDRDEREI